MHRLVTCYGEKSEDRFFTVPPGARVFIMRPRPAGVDPRTLDRIPPNWETEQYAPGDIVPDVSLIPFKCCSVTAPDGTRAPVTDSFQSMVFAGGDTYLNLIAADEYLDRPPGSPEIKRV